MNLKIGNVFMSKFVGNGPRLMKESVCHAAVSQRLRKVAVEYSDILERSEVNHSKE